MASGGLAIPVFPDPVYGQNGRILHPAGARACWVIDPGLPPSASSMLNYLESNELIPESLFLTHAHADHIAGIPEVLERYPDLPVYLARPEWAFLADPSSNLSIMAGTGFAVEVPELRDLAPAATFELGGSSWTVLDTSGHSPGGRTLYCREHSVAVSGDALFAGSIGRTDFPHSDGRRLIANIRERLLSLPGDTRVLAGHGPDTTVAAERESNPFVGRRAPGGVR